MATPLDPLKMWLEKKSYLEEQLVFTADPNQKYALRQHIIECNQEIARLESQRSSTAQTSQTAQGNISNGQINSSINPTQMTQANDTNDTIEQRKPIMAIRQEDVTSKTVSQTKLINILHLSDIHLGTVDQAKTYYNRLRLDLTQNLQLQELQYLVISGDIANKSTKEEYEAAFELVNDIKLNFGLKSAQVIIAPGNHDLNWDLSGEAYVYVPQHALPSSLSEDYVKIPGGALRFDKDKYKKRFDNFANFYKRVCGNDPYPSEYEDQAVLHAFAEHKILFLSLNSAWQIDHLNTSRANINHIALGKALSKVTTSNYTDWLKIAVWHHPVTGLEMMNADFLEQLAVAGFEICMHGHIHEAISSFYNYDPKRSLHIIGGGTFGAPTKEQITSIPLQYNLLTLDPSKASITVKSRKKEKVDGAWSADARWGDKEEPKTFYSIKLKHSFQQNEKPSKTASATSQSQQHLELPTKNAPNKTNDALRPILEQRKAEILDEIAAAYKQLGFSLSEVEKTRIQRQISNLQQELNGVDSQLRLMNLM